MSEFQYYQFLSLDRPMSADTRRLMASLSSRAQLTSNSAAYTYSYGDFRGDPEQLLHDHFDAMLYLTNWGTRQLMFRFPANSISPEIMEAYQFAEGLTWTADANYIVLDIAYNDENGDLSGWIDEDDYLSDLAPLRNDILSGDLRALYLAWLRFAADYGAYEIEEGETLPEPPVPPLLGKLSPAHNAFLDFFGIATDLVAAAAQASPANRPREQDLRPLLAQLDDAEKAEWLARLLSGEANLHLALARRLRSFTTEPTPAASAGPRRDIVELLAAADRVHEAREAEEAQQAEAKRQAHLAKVSQNETFYWTHIPGLIEQKRANTYAEAVALLVDLRDLAIQRGEAPAFRTKVADLKARYPTLRAFHDRLRDAGLI